jgi:uncharacterized protein YcfJ
MNRFFYGPGSALGRLAMTAFLALVLTSCVMGYPPPPPLMLSEPASVPGAVSASSFDVAAMAYADDGEGLNFSMAGLAPVLIVLRNKTAGYPLIDPAEVWGIAPGREYASYPPLAAADVAEATSAFDESAKAALRGATAGAVIGAGVGTLFGAAVGGGAALWRGALIGGGLGAFTGAVSSLPEARYQLRRGIDTELETLALRPIPAPPYGMAAGYVYFPAGAGIGWVRLTVRDQGGASTYDVPIAPAPRQKQGKSGKSAPAQAAAPSPAGQPAPAYQPTPTTQAPVQAPAYQPAPATKAPVQAPAYQSVPGYQPAPPAGQPAPAAEPAQTTTP